MADPLNPFGSPFGPAFGQVPNPFLQPRQQPPALPLPDLTPEEQSSLLGRVGEESLGGLAYLGKLLDKVTFARPVRGAIGGLQSGTLADNPRELLSFLPFSDTLGLTRERDVVHGTDLLERAGVLTPGDDSFENLAAGVAAEIATDPATLTGGAFVKPLVKGYGKAAQYAGRGLGKATEYATGGYVNPYTFGAGLAERAGRQGSALFERAAQGATSAGGQPLGREVFTPTLDAGLAAARQEWADPLVELRQFAAGPGRSEQKLFDALAWRAEDFPERGVAALRAAGYTDPEVARINEIFDPFLARVRGTQPREAALGAAAPALDNVPDWVKEARRPVEEARAAANQDLVRAQIAHADAPSAETAADLAAAQQAAALAGREPLPYADFKAPGYFPRQLADFEGGTFRGRVARLTGGGPHSLEREDVFRGIPTPVVQAWSRSPALTGADRTLTPLQAQYEILQGIVPGADLTHPAASQAKQVADYLYGLNPRARETGLFSDDILGAGLGRLEQEATTVASERTVMEGIRRFARPLADLQREGVRAVPVPSFLAKTKFVGDPAREKAAGLLGLDPTTAGGVDQMRAFGLPEDVANDMLRMGEAVKTPAVLAPVVAAWDWALNLFKTSLTTVFPAFHARNLMSGLFNMWRDGALSTAALDQSQKLLRGGGLYPEVAARLYPNLPYEQANKEFLKEVIANKVAFVRGSRQTSDVTGAVGLDRMLPSQVPEVGGAVRGVGEDLGTFGSELVPNRGRVFEELVNPLNQAGVNRETDVNRLVDAGRKLGNTTEDFVRLGHYIAKRQAGATADEAVAATMKYQIDYCVDEATQAMTKDGWKGIDELKVGDEVLTIGPDNGRIVWQPVLAVNVFDSPGSLVRWKHSTFDAFTTRNHRWLAASSGVRGGHHTTRHLRPQTHFVTTGEVAEWGNKRLVVAGGSPAATAADKMYTDEFVELVGWYVTEGWTSKSPYGVYVAQSQRHNPTNCDRIRAIQRHYAAAGIVASEYAPRDRGWGPVVTWRFGKGVGDEVIAAAPDKVIPIEFMNRLTGDQLRLLFDTMMAADGTVNKSGTRIFGQKDVRRAEAFQHLCSLLGIRSSLRRLPSGYHTVTAYRKDRLHTGNLGHVEEEYGGRVWCPTTANGTWMARRNGFTYWTGNSDLSGFERAVMKRVAPWYAYSRRSLPVVLEDLATRPAKLAGAMRFATNMRDPYDYVPDFVAEGASVTAPEFMAGPEGYKRYFTSLGLPFEDEALKTLASGIQGDVGRVGQQLFGMAVPWLKVPAEVATGTQMFSGRRLEDLRPYEFMTAGGLIPEDLARRASQVAANTPFSRLASSVDKLIDTRKGLGTTALNLGTGIRVSDVDEVKMREVAAREALKDALRGTPGVRVREDVYVPKELQGNLNPYQLDLLAVLKAQEKKVAEQQKARQAAGR